MNIENLPDKPAFFFEQKVWHGSDGQQIIERVPHGEVPPDFSVFVVLYEDDEIRTQIGINDAQTVTQAFEMYKLVLSHALPIVKEKAKQKRMQQRNHIVMPGDLPTLHRNNGRRHQGH
jgi:hypothetical protein